MEERGTIDVKVCQSLAHTELVAQYFILKLNFSNLFSLSNLFSFQFSQALGPIYMNQSEH